MMESEEIVMVDRWKPVPIKDRYRGLKVAVMNKKCFKFHCKENVTNFGTASSIWFSEVT